MMGLTPDAFWNMTLVEWRAALGGFAQRRGMQPSAGPPMRRAELVDLMQLYPDTKS